MFVGRRDYLKMLEQLWSKTTASFVTCRGRRRIGKSTLIEEFASRTAEHFISIEGLPPRKGLTDAIQRRHVCERLSELTGQPVSNSTSWPLVFAALDEVIPVQGRTVVLLDEISWLGGYNADFPGYLKQAWDHLFKKHDNLIFIICGSVSAWIAENILESTGFVGRDSLDLQLEELTLHESLQLLQPTGSRLSSRELFDLLSVTGGVPKYLEEVRMEYSVDENIRRLCFTPNGLLFREFDETFSNVFGKKIAARKQLLEELAKSPASMSELAKRENQTTSGYLSRSLKELELAGFTARDCGLNPMTMQPLRQERYRIKDNYVRFYLHFIEPYKNAVEKGLFKFSSMEQLQARETVLGLQFENLILNHVVDLFPYLGLENSLVLSAAPFIQKSTTRGEGCQIDLLIITKRMAMIVEIKRRQNITHDVIDEVTRKCNTLRLNKKLSLRTALVYDGELSPSVPADHFFDFIVPAEKLLD